MDRRAVLGGVGTVTVLSMAGCLRILENGPKDVVERFYEAIHEGDADAANTLIHPEREAFEIAEADIEDVTIEELKLEERSLSEILRRRLEDDFVDEEEREAFIEQREETIRDNLESKFDDYVFVHASVSYESYGEQDEYVTVVEDDGDWYIYE